MKNHWCLLLIMLTCCLTTARGQDAFNEIREDGSISQRGSKRDSLQSGDKEIPRGLKTWTVDERFGDRTPVVPDTVPYMYMNSIFNEGLRGEYNTTGNIGSARINRIVTDRPLMQQFMFTQPYDHFITRPGELRFTNTYSPITNLSFNECGDKMVGENHLKALFAVNAGKRLGAGFKFDYIYGRGYYQNQSTSHFNYTLWTSYLGERYQAHLLLSTNHQKVTENGGVTNDDYVSHPELTENDFRNDEIPVMLERNWNRNDNQHIFLTHRYNIGFNRKVPMTEEEIKAKKFAMEAQKDAEARKAKLEAMKQAKKEGREWNEEEYNRQLKEQKKSESAGRPSGAAVVKGSEPADTTATASQRIKVSGKAQADSLLAADKKQEEEGQWMKNELVPVTSFIHTVQFDNYRRIYEAYKTPNNYYKDTYETVQKFMADSIYDQFRHYDLKNTFAISLLEGFNKWAKAGLKGFVSHDLRHFELPDTAARPGRWNEHSLSVGGQLVKTQGRLLHYNATLETWLAGEDAGQLKIDAAADLNFRLFGDTVRLAASGSFYRLQPTFFHRHYHSRHLWWDNDELSKELRTRLQAQLSYEKTRTRIRVVLDDLKNYTYFASQYTTVGETRTGNTISVGQCSDNISLLTLQLAQDITLGPLNWESVVTYQKSSKQEVLPVPDLNVYTNLYLRFKVSKVLNIDLGADMRYFTKYEAPEYSPYIGQFAVQDNGDANVEVGNHPFINVYANMFLKHTRFFIMMSHVNGSGGNNRFTLPHYPMNGNILRFGVSWNFFN